MVLEATRDAGGSLPQYLRVDFLVDKQGVGWRGGSVFAKKHVVLASLGDYFLSALL